MHHIMIQRATKGVYIPTDALLRLWAAKAIGRVKSTEATIRIVTVTEMATLNKTYRKKSGPTNVLSFPFEAPCGVPLKQRLLGDIVICAEVVNQEASDQGKTKKSHWAHMVVHGMYHLQGFDHEKKAEAKVMEAKEIRLLKLLGFANPYASRRVSLT